METGQAHKCTVDVQSLNTLVSGLSPSMLENGAVLLLPKHRCCCAGGCQGVEPRVNKGPREIKSRKKERSKKKQRPKRLDERDIVWKVSGNWFLGALLCSILSIQSQPNQGICLEEHWLRTVLSRLYSGLEVAMGSIRTLWRANGNGLIIVGIYGFLLFLPFFWYISCWQLFSFFSSYLVWNKATLVIE